MQPARHQLTPAGGSRVTEDAFINFRVVDVTLRARQPFAFNAGERVEAATSPLWVAALAVLEATLGRLVDLEWLSVLTGLGLSLLGLAACRGCLVAACPQDQHHR